MELGHTLANGHFDIEDFLESYINILLVLPLLIFANWKGMFSVISGVVIGFRTYSKHHKISTTSKTPYRHHIRSELQSLLSSLLVWVALTLALWLSNTLSAWESAWASGEVELFFNHEKGIRAKTNPCGCFAMLIPFVTTITGILHLLVLRIGTKAKTKGASPRPTLLSRSWLIICVLISISIGTAFLMPVVENAVVVRWKAHAVSHGYSADIIKTSRSVGSAPWVVLNTPAENRVVDYLHALVTSELSSSIMGLFPYTVGGCAGAAVGVWVASLFKAEGKDQLKVRGAFKWLFLLPVCQAVVAVLWAIFGDDFKGSQMMELFGCSDESESLTHHGGNYELFLCSGQLPVLLWAIWRWDLKEGIDRERIVRKSLWLRRFGSYSLSCFVYDTLYLGFVQWLGWLYIPSCRDPEGMLEECAGYVAFLHMMVLGFAAVYLLLRVFDLMHGFLSMDWWLSAVGGLLRHALEGKARGWWGVWEAVKPQVDRNHVGVEAIVLCPPLKEETDVDDVVAVDPEKGSEAGLPDLEEMVPLREE